MSRFSLDLELEERSLLRVDYRLPGACLDRYSDVDMALRVVTVNVVTGEVAVGGMLAEDAPTLRVYPEPEEPALAVGGQVWVDLERSPGLRRASSEYVVFGWCDEAAGPTLRLPPGRRRARRRAPEPSPQVSFVEHPGAPVLGEAAVSLALAREDERWVARGRARRPERELDEHGEPWPQVLTALVLGHHDRQVRAVSVPLPEGDGAEVCFAFEVGALLGGAQIPRAYAVALVGDALSPVQVLTP